MEDAEGAAAQIQKNAANCPANRRLPLVIEPGLWRVLDYRHGERNVREIGDGSEPGEDAESSDRHQDDCRRHERHRKDVEAQRKLLVASFVDDHGDDDQQDGPVGVKNENDVVDGDRNARVVVLVIVLRLEERREVEAAIVSCDANEADDV